MSRLLTHTVAVIALMCALIVPANAVTIIANGLAPPNPANVINDASLAAETVHIEGGPGLTPTTVALAPGGVVAGFAAGSQGIALVEGGTVSGIAAVNAGDGRLEIRAGQVGEVDSFEGPVVIQGGTIGQIGLASGAKDTISGGSFGVLGADNFSTFHFFGSQLVLDGVAFTNGEARFVSASGLAISGVLADGSSFSTSIDSFESFVRFSFLPEPLLGWLLAGLFACTVGSRARPAATSAQ